MLLNKTFYLFIFVHSLPLRTDLPRHTQRACAEDCPLSQLGESFPVTIGSQNVIIILHCRRFADIWLSIVRSQMVNRCKTPSTDIGKPVLLTDQEYIANFLPDISNSFTIQHFKKSVYKTDAAVGGGGGIEDWERARNWLKQESITRMSAKVKH